MSKQFVKQSIAIAIIFSFLVLSFFHPVNIIAQTKSRPAAKQSAVKSASVLRLTDAMLKETSKIRELPILYPVKSGTKSRAQIERMILKNLNNENAPDSIKNDELILKKLGLVPKNFDYRSLILKLLTEQIAGFYDPKTKEFFLADWLPLEGQKSVMVHELTHALQDQHFDLTRFESWSKKESDSRLAVSALIEGDAVGAMMQYIMRDPINAAKNLGSMDAGGSDEFNNTPRALRETFIFPYLQGSDFAGRLYSKGGWELVSNAYRSLPQSTEHILHVDKYLMGEKPVKIELPDLSADFGEGWKQIENNVNGEWGYYLQMVDFLSGNEEAAKAAAGWGGDRFTVYANRKNEVVFLAKTSWDTDRDAQEFFDAYAKRTTKRYNAERQTNGISQGVMQGAFWKTNEGQVILLKNASSVLILEGVPDSLKPENLIVKMWMSK